jgi:uncharacterized peroxidase-related enzyme
MVHQLAAIIHFIGFLASSFLYCQYRQQNRNRNKMPRLKALSPDEASGKVKELFNAINSKFGVVPNMMRAMGNSPSFLEGFLNFHAALSNGTLGAKAAALIALAIAEANACHYCLAAHTYVGKNVGNLDAKTMEDARLGSSTNEKTNTILKFALALVNKKGRVSDEDVKVLKAAGVTDGEVVEIIGHVALNIATNYFNNTINTEIDFPKV